MGRAAAAYADADGVQADTGAVSYEGAGAVTDRVFGARKPSSGRVFSEEQEAIHNCYFPCFIFVRSMLRTIE